MAADPHVDLFETFLQDFLVISKEVVTLKRARDIYNDPYQKVFIERTPVSPNAECGHKVRRGR